MLIDAAKSLGKLDDLAGQLKSLQLAGIDDAGYGERAKLAFTGLSAMARGDEQEAAAVLKTIKPLLTKIAADAPESLRWPEMVLAARTISQAKLRQPAVELLEIMAEQAAKQNPIQADTKASIGLWIRQVKNIRACADLLAEHEKPGAGAAPRFGSDPDAPRWARVTQTTAETRGLGEPITHWGARDDTFRHYPGHALDLMYLAIPLRGEFEVNCELTGAADCKIRLQYGGLAIGPKADLKHLERAQFGRPVAELSVNPPLEKPSEWFPYRLVVKGGRMTAYISGRKVHEAPVTPDSDPWLALLSEDIQTGSVRKITIAGDPQIPEKISLSAQTDLAGWTASEYGDTTTGDDPDWDKRGEEITGRMLDDVAGSKRESVLRYHRPMLEDGRITYEFYHEPGKVMAHPALGRVVFLLEPDGVKLHLLTDGAYERSGLAPDNIREEPECRRGPASLPLKPQAWNQVVISVAGDKVTLELNGQPIFERPIEPTNQRSFGLFHYADQSQVRARNVTYQGSWLRLLPAAIRPRGLASGEKK